jgi:hypothetical protein
MARGVEPVEPPEDETTILNLEALPPMGMWLEWLDACLLEGEAAAGAAQATGLVAPF